MQNTSGNEFLGPLVEIVFHIFPILHWIMKRRGRMGGRGCPIPFRIFVDHVTIFNLSPMQHLKWSTYCDKKS